MGYTSPQWVMQHTYNPCSSNCQYETLTQCWFKVGPTSATLAQHYINIWSLHTVSWTNTRLLYPPNHQMSPSVHLSLLTYYRNNNTIRHFTLPLITLGFLWSWTKFENSEVGWWGKPQLGFFSCTCFKKYIEKWMGGGGVGWLGSTQSEFFSDLKKKIMLTRPLSIRRLSGHSD